MRADLLAPQRSRLRRQRTAAAAVALAITAAAAITAARLDLPRHAADAFASRVATFLPAPSSPPPIVVPAPLAVAAAPARAEREAAVQTRPLSAWLGDIAREAERELVISPDVRGDLTATAGADKLDWRSRIDAYARVFGFEVSVGDGLIEVRPVAKAGGAMLAAGGVKRPFVAGGEAIGEDASGAASSDAPRSIASAAAGAAASVQSGRTAASGNAAAAGSDKPPAPPQETRVASLSYAPAKELAAVVDKAAQALGVSAAADIASNALVLSGPRAGLEKASALVAQLDRPRRRVLLEAKIIEIAHSARRDLGVEWKLTGDVGADVRLPAPVSDAGSAALLIATNGASALDARITALEANGRLRVVSRPSVVMLEGSPATIESVRILRIRLPSRGAVVGDDVVEVSNSNDRATQDIPVGVRLEVTPGVRAGRRVLLRISAKSSSLGAPLPPDDIPEELSRMVEAEVMVGDGETAVLGGLLREAGTDSGAGVPFLRDVPVLGHIFNRRSRQREAEELVVLVTPRVLE